MQIDKIIKTDRLVNFYNSLCQNLNKFGRTALSQRWLTQGMKRTFKWISKAERFCKSKLILLFSKWSSLTEHYLGWAHSRLHLQIAQILWKFVVHIPTNQPFIETGKCLRLLYIKLSAAFSYEYEERLSSI